jgi:predicted nicotinamide N-methyase
MHANDVSEHTNEDFVSNLTRLQTPPHTPELHLHLSDDLEQIWSAVQRRSGRPDEPIPFWAFAWAGGLAVARYLLDHRDLVAGKRVLDVATGSGLCAIAARMAGAASVCAADIDPLCGVAVAMNAAANGVDVAFIAGDLLASPPPEVDLIVAGDIGYERVLAGVMIDWLGIAHRNKTMVLIGDPERRYFPRKEVLQVAHYDIETTLELESSARKQTGVYTFPEPA